ncbi:MAG: hypothetical protein EZS28_023721 [Streblomastix strix]|uniref:Uncharacterized protein n=1 Tax=Streblomastix strix TaxID=222440 RepID=A0A5J4VE66_9EUKA|nr:MAG: hypothetical protein EZS28_023721 [Streblomastix strix]
MTESEKNRSKARIEKITGQKGQNVGVIKKGHFIPVKNKELLSFEVDDDEDDNKKLELEKKNKKEIIPVQNQQKKELIHNDLSAPVQFKSVSEREIESLKKKIDEEEQEEKEYLSKQLPQFFGISGLMTVDEIKRRIQEEKQKKKNLKQNKRNKDTEYTENGKQDVSNLEVQKVSDDYLLALGIPKNSKASNLNSQSQSQQQISNSLLAERIHLKSESSSVGGSISGGGQIGSMIRAAELVVDHFVDEKEQQRQRTNARKHIFKHNNSLLLQNINEFEKTLNGNMWSKIEQKQEEDEQEEEQDGSNIEQSDSGINYELNEEKKQKRKREKEQENENNTNQVGYINKRRRLNDENINTKRKASALDSISSLYDDDNINNEYQIDAKKIENQNKINITSQNTSQIPISKSNQQIKKQSQQSNNETIHRFLDREDADDFDISDKQWMQHKMSGSRDTSDIMINRRNKFIGDEDDTLIIIDTANDKKKSKRYQQNREGDRNARLKRREIEMNESEKQKLFRDMALKDHDSNK